MTFNMNLNTICLFCFLKAPEEHMSFFCWSITYNILTRVGLTVRKKFKIFSPCKHEKYTFFSPCKHEKYTFLQGEFSFLIQKVFPVFTAFPLTYIHQKQSSACIFKNQSIAKNQKSLSISVLELSCIQTCRLLACLLAYLTLVILIFLEIVVINFHAVFCKWKLILCALIWTWTL